MDETFEWIVLAISAGVIFLAMLLEVRGEVQVVLPWLGRPLPEICTFRRLLNLPCPGCGLTRSFISLGHGRWDIAWMYHPGGPPLFFALLLQIPLRVVRLWQLRRQRSMLRTFWVNGPIALALGVIFITGIVRMFR